MTRPPGRYAFPQAGAEEARRLELFEQRLDPLTQRRVARLGLAPGSRCLELGSGHGSIARWLCDQVGRTGSVTATDLETDFLEGLGLPNLTVVRNDLRTDDLPAGPFDLVHARAVLMHIADRMTALERMVSRLAPGGWLLVEEPDFGMWLRPRRRVGTPSAVTGCRGRPGCGRPRQRGQRRSNRSRFITRFHAVTKSRTNFSPASLCA